MNKEYNNKQLVIYGGYYLNKGGTAITYGTLKVLRELGIDFKYIIDPEPFPSQTFTDLNLTPIYRYADTFCRKSISSVNPIQTITPLLKCLINSYKPQIKQLKGSPIWAIGDGCFSDQRSVLSLIGQVISLWSLHQVISGKLVIGGISLQHSRTKIGNILLKHFFGSVDHFFIRGAKTHETLRELKVPDEKISEISDFAFQLNQIDIPDPNKTFNLIRENSKPKIALILREYSQGQERTKYIESIKTLVSKLNENNYDISFISTSYAFLIPENDLVFLQNTLHVPDDRIINIETQSPEEIIQTFSKLDVIISARLHGAVYSILAGTPTIHLCEAPKSYEVVGIPFKEYVPLFKLSDLSKENGVDEMMRLVKDLILRRDDISSAMKIHIGSMNQLSISQIKNVIEAKKLLE